MEDKSRMPAAVSQAQRGRAAARCSPQGRGGVGATRDGSLQGTLDGTGACRGHWTVDSLAYEVSM